MLVASIETSWAGLVIPVRKQVLCTSYGDEAIKEVHLDKGEELGRFLLGSTAIVLFPENTAQWDDNFQAGTPTLMGQKLGTLT